MKPVPVDVVTGFLGAGKTTLLQAVLRGALAGERVAVVMNELGDVSIDGRVIRGLEHVETMVELDNGCVCCSIDDFAFDAALQEVVRRADPTLIVLETTGVADPGPLTERLRRAGLPLDAVITVVDAASIERLLLEVPVVRAQIRAADFLLLNKVDLVDEAMLRRLEGRLRALNRRALTRTCERGRVAADLLFATSARRLRAPAAESRAMSHDADVTAGAPAQPHAGGGHGHGAERLSAFSWRAECELDQRRFERFLANLPPNIYRAKGFVRFGAADWPCLFSYTCGRYELNWIQLDGLRGVVEAVFIGRDAERTREAILGALENCRAR
jgi:G3E family GTPase